MRVSFNLLSKQIRLRWTWLADRFQVSQGGMRVARPRPPHPGPGGRGGDRGRHRRGDRGRAGRAKHLGRGYRPLAVGEVGPGAGSFETGAKPGVVLERQGRRAGFFGCVDAEVAARCLRGLSAA